MLLTPLALGLLARGRWWLLALASWGLWAAYQVWPHALQLPWPIAGNSVFKLASWQVLFFVGLALGHEREWLARRLAARWPRSPLRDGWLAPLALLLGALIWVHATNGAAFDPYAPGGSMAAVLDAWFDKSALPPARLAACAVVFTFAWALVTRLWRPLRATTGGVLLPLGQGALYAYAAHLFLVVAVHLAVVWVWGSGEAGSYPFLHPGVNALLQLGAVAVLWALTKGRVLQAVVAPLGNPPLSRLPARLGRWPLWRPSDALVTILLVALVAGNAAALGGRDGATNAGAGAGSDATPAARSEGQGYAPEVSTVVAPRKVAGPARGSSGTPPASAVAAPAPVVAATGTPGARQGEASPAVTIPADAVAGGAVQADATPTPTPTPAETAPAGGYLRDGEFYSRALSRTMPYGIYLPPGYDAGAQRYPVLYMLHGTGGHYSEWVAFGLTEAAEDLIATGQIPPLLIVLPQGDQSYWVDHAGADGERWADYVARDLVEHVDATYRTLPTAGRRAIGGLSMGGFGALSLALAHTDVFGVVGAHSPSLRGSGDLPAFLGDADAYKKVDPLELALSLDPLAAPRLWLDVGEEDQWAERVNALHKLLRDRAIAHEYRATPGGHDPDYWRRHAAEYLRFYATALLAP
jgi:enterochelin esterase-like enzyme